MKTALLIDDDRGTRLILARVFKRQGWQVLEAGDGEAGLEMAARHRPDVVVCDLLMPRMNGFQVCRQLRERNNGSGLPKIVVTTASAYPTDRTNALEAGANEYLIKPIDPAELTAALDRLTGDTPAAKKAAAAGAGKKAQPPAAAPIAPGEDTGVRLRFWGVRGSIPTPGPGTAFYGGNTSCVEVRADGEIIVLDAGTGIRPLGLKLISEFKGEPMGLTLLITHTHWDHIQGFPFFIPAYNPKNSLRILGYEGAREGLESTLSSQMESPYFPISMQQMPGYLKVEELKELKFSIGKVAVQAQFMNHPGICVGYRLNTSAGSIAFVPDNEPFTRLKTQSATPSDHEAAAMEFAKQQDAKLVEFLRDVDVLIMDSQYDASEYPRHIGWGHTCLEDTVAIAMSANARQLFLFHHDPGHDDTHVSHMVAWARKVVSDHGSKLIVEGAREGVECVLKAAKTAG
ncbi:MAG: response regulator [Verrucomicrobia bacterium]|nr:response regulator [Verrucomicrobiota bacterium]